MKFRLFSPTQDETILDAKVFFQTQLPWTPNRLDKEALAYSAQRWTAEQVKAPFEYRVVDEDGQIIRILLLDKNGARWPW